MCKVVPVRLCRHRAEHMIAGHVVQQFVAGATALTGGGLNSNVMRSGEAMKKKFKLRASDIKPLANGHGGCIATDMITVDGMPVGFMCREEPNNPQDSGWCFTSGHESQEYMDDAKNHAIYDVNTIANYDPEIIPLLGAPIGSAYERDESGKFVEIIDD